MAKNLFDAELEHVKFLKGSGYDFVCSGCNFVYRKKPVERCDYCGDDSFSTIESVISKLERGIKSD